MRAWQDRWPGLLLLAFATCRPAESKAPLPQHYADKDAAIARFDNPARDAWAMPDRVVAALPLDDPAATVADIGAGSGYFSRRLANRVPNGQVLAVDVDSDFKRHIETHRDAWGTPNIEPRLAVYENPLLPAAAVDLVFVSNTYAYLNDRIAYFQAVHRALTPDGTLAIVEFRKDAQCESADVCPPVEHRIPRAQAIAELEQAGFRLEREETFLPWQYFLLLRKAAELSTR
ncbi:MAG: class I SAM-dependent methyltransferase [Myxococcales bacterium FL481]|nr:MAG: class I SAM-dependent methyltransferase [Myxococcales bacterium FL481]